MMQGDPRQANRQTTTYSDDGTQYISQRGTSQRGTVQLSYLLRLWCNGDGNWRASLHAVQNGERHMFADLESLLAFLCDHARPPPVD